MMRRIPITGFAAIFLLSLLYLNGYAYYHPSEDEVETLGAGACSISLGASE